MPTSSVSPTARRSALTPQHRLLLEVGWEALLDAGQPPAQLFGSTTGVFVGISSFDYSQLRAQSGEPDSLDAYHATGIAHSAASGRLSYYWGLQGPSVSVDTACSSSLVAVHQACQSLRSGESRLALAGGVNLILSPELHLTLSKARMMAPDGRCKAFDDLADGFVRSEGCGVVILKLLDDAIAQGDRIHAVIRGSACNQDGRSSGLTAPNGPSQTAVLQAAWRAAGIAPGDVSYVEAHGTGTALGDPIEAGALTAALADAPAGHVLQIGSVKSNLGHMEAAAGVGGLIKTVLALENERLPASLHFQSPSKNIDWQSGRLRVISESTAWPRTSAPRRAGISSFGFSGTNVHVVIEEAPALQPKTNEARPVQLITVSAMNEAALRELAARYAACLRAEGADRFADFVFTANAGRPHFTQRVALVAAAAAEAATKLAAFAETGAADSIATGQASALTLPEVVFTATVSPAASFELRGELYRTLPAFRAAIDQCATAWRSQVGGSLFDTAANDSQEHIRQHVHQWALAETWRAWGIQPNMAYGEGAGAYVAACVAGVFGLDDAIKLVISRAHLSAAGNGSSASRSEFVRLTETIRYAAPAIPFFSDVLNRPLAVNEIPDAAYWQRQAFETRRDSQSIAAQWQGNNQLQLELSTGASEPLRQVWDTLAKLYIRGAAIDWKEVSRGASGQLMTLPAYPWSRKRYWFPSAPRSIETTTPAKTADNSAWQAAVAAGGRQAEQGAVGFPGPHVCRQVSSTR